MFNPTDDWVPSANTQELDYRENDGIQVSLRWDKNTDKVYVVIDDTKLNFNRVLLVDPAHAKDAFEHPFAYA